MTNVIQNPTFISVLAPWTVVEGNITWQSGSPDGLPPGLPPGSGAAFFVANPETPAELEQSNINTPPGIYQMSFWVDDRSNPNDLIVTVNGVEVYNDVPMTGSNWVFFTIPFPIPILQNISTISMRSTFGINMYITDVRLIFQQPICYTGDSKFLTKNIKNGEICEILAKEVYSDRHFVYSSVRQEYVPIIHNAIAGITDRIKFIAKDSIEKDQPNDDLKITSGHVIIYKGQEVKVRDIKEAVTKKIEPQYLYTIVIDKREPIKVNGLDVMAYSQNEWYEYVKEKNILWKDNKI